MGPKLKERDALELTHNAIKAGAAGVDMGRNIWQSEYPVPMIRAVRAIVHGNANVNQAYDIFKNLAKETKPIKQAASKPSKPKPVKKSKKTKKKRK